MIKIYGKQNCPHCISAKQYLSNREVQFEYIGIDYWTQEEKQALIAKFNMRSVPIIVNTDGTLIGGFTDLQKSMP